MKSKAKKLFVKLTSCVCTKMAFSVSASACSWGAFQPEEPKCLKK